MPPFQRYPHLLQEEYSRMKWFKNLNATPRLLLSFGVLIVLIAASAISQSSTLAPRTTACRSSTKMT
jgi:hypothetical protein